ncbi:hypothetical protein VTK73DRAFT_10072 [Phialemonium thermophilum]|uniref:Uncharacterized protein n=1 Tax=Phialemonium thermophilum TaxID=223376 RepID=A0ABR3XIA3_9PEZI
MNPHPAFPEPATRASYSSRPQNWRAQSRFVEGSMNDRTSNIPPPSFLGPNDVAAYERQFYTSVEQPRPTTSGAQSTRKPSSKFFAPLWDGVREKLGLSRSRSSGSMPSREDNGFFQHAYEEHHAKQLLNGYQTTYPSRDEVMESYKNLVDSRFFSAHAIQGSRHRLKTAPDISLSESDMSISHNLPVTASASRGQFWDKPPQRGSHPRTQSVSTFSSIPYSATKSTSSAELLSSSTHPLENRRLQPLTSSIQQERNQQRGTKRAVSDIAGGVVEREPAESSGVTRKLAKKLRKSASRVSSDLSAGAAGIRSISAAFSAPSSTMSSTTQTAPLRSAPLDAGASDQSRNGKDPQRPSGGGIPKFNSRRGRYNSGSVSGRLSKPRKAANPGRPRRRSTSRSPVPPSRPMTPLRCSPKPVAVSSRPTGAMRHAQECLGEGEPMVIDSQAVDRPSFDGIINPLSVPSFHYPQRVRAARRRVPLEPLSFVPDDNRGIPSVPKIPDQFNLKRAENGHFSNSRDLRSR